MSDIAIIVSLLSLVAVLGLWLGHLKIKGVDLALGAFYSVG
ncbi:transporter [Actinobacillus equuli]|nr:transporter [Actinobacillus equuli]